MRQLSKWSLAVMLPALCTTALADPGVQVRITNEGTADVMVTVYDMSRRPERILIENARLNGFASMPLEVAGDGSGRAVIAWTAVNVDTTAPKCGEADGVRVTNAAAVDVSAEESCAS